MSEPHKFNGVDPLQLAKDTANLFGLLGNMTDNLKKGLDAQLSLLPEDKREEAKKMMNGDLFDEKVADIQKHKDTLFKKISDLG